MSLVRRYALLSVATAVSVAMAGCQKAPEQKAATEPTWQLDETKLMAPVRFQAADLDPQGNACMDLAGYVNDKWTAANPIPSDQVSWGPGNILAERSRGVRLQLVERAAALSAPTGVDKILADLWVTGMDEAKLNAQGAAPLADRLAAIEALKDGAAIGEYLRKVAATGENPLFSFGPQADFKDSTQNVAAAFQGGLTLPDTTYYFDAEHKGIREAFVKHIARMLELSGRSAADAAREATDVMKFETRLAKASKSQEQLSRDVELYYNPVTLAQADKLTPNFPWTTFFASQRVAAPKLFSLGIPDFHREVSRMIDDVPVGAWRSYLRFRLLDDAAPYLSDNFVEASFDFHNKTLLGQKEQRARWKRVLGGLEGAAGEALGQRYVEVAFPPSSKAQMEQLVTNLREALKVRIENLTWMSDATRAKALEKWAAFTTKIGYPEKWRDWSGLVTGRDSFYANLVAAQAFNYRWSLDKIGKPVDRTEWQMTPQTVNAYYDPQQNEIVFPAAILQPPFFDPQADDPLNYGAIGAIIGHELTHGYDDQGARFGPTGNFEQWWTSADEKKFKALTTSLAKQYSAYDAAPGVKVNGNLTLGENIADLGGLSIAFDALQKASAGKDDPRIDGLSREQRLFFGWATAWRAQLTPELIKVVVASDPHSPDRVRANGTVVNVPAFASAFGCKEGDALVSPAAKRVTIW